MNLSTPFILRPIGTALMALGLLLVGMAAYATLPVASLPNVELPTIRVSASLPGADPETMASIVAAPLERRLGEIAGVNEMSSTSRQGSTTIVLQFDIRRDVESAARDVQGAINAAGTELPADMPALPSFRKMNPNALPVLVMAMTSRTVRPSALYDAADSVVAQRIMQVRGVADVTLSGAEQPAIRVRLNPLRLAAMGIGAEQVRQAIAAANTNAPVGIMETPTQAIAIAINDQLRTVEDYRELVIRTPGGRPVRLGDIAEIEQSTRNVRSMATYNGEPAVLLQVIRDPRANVIETVDAVQALIPEIKRWVPEGVDFHVVNDRTQTIRASVKEMQLALALSVGLVMLVVLAFLRRTAPMAAAGITVPLSLAGTVALMWLFGFGLDNLSLMALAVSVGFIVDDAIVMIENIFRNIEAGQRPMDAALDGARQIGSTILTIGIALIAAFIPLLFMDGAPGKLVRAFSVTLTFAIIVSTVVTLTVTAMLAAHLVRHPPSRDATFADRAIEGALGSMTRGYGRTLEGTLQHNGLMLLVVLLTIVLTTWLYIKTPKGYFPEDDTGIVHAWLEVSPGTSFQRMIDLQSRAAEIARADPAVHGVGYTTFSTMSAQLVLGLKPRAERGGVTTIQVADRLRRQMDQLPGISVWISAQREVRTGGRQSNSDFQWTLWSNDIQELAAAVPRVEAAIRAVPGIIGVWSDRHQGGLQANIVTDRLAAARLGVSVQDISSALNNAFAQRQISIIYGPRNQYRVVLEVEPQFQRAPGDLSSVYVTARGGGQVPMSAVTRIEKGLAPLAVNHAGQFPSVTISYSVPPEISAEEAHALVERAIMGLKLPDTIRANQTGDLKAFKQQANSQPLLILMAIVAVYIVLGVLYESLLHPVTIISTLPSAGLGALIALWATTLELSIIAFIAIILLIGIVMKNGIMMVDFAVHAQRTRGLDAQRAILEASLVRFRPILMTTLASILGAVPLAFGSGPGSELRRPLGVAIIGGLLVSQILTLYTTPAIYVLMEKLKRRRPATSDHSTQPSAEPPGGAGSGATQPPRGAGAF
jgi:multidrug efflux pump